MRALREDSWAADFRETEKHKYVRGNKKGKAWQRRL